MTDEERIAMQEQARNAAVEWAYPLPGARPLPVHPPVET